MAASRCQPSAGRFAAAALSGKGDGSRVIPARCQMPRQSNCTAPPSGTTASGSHNRQSASAYMQVLAPVDLLTAYSKKSWLPDDLAQVLSRLELVRADDVKQQRVSVSSQQPPTL